HWIPLGDGTFNLRHIDRATGAQLSQNETLSRIAERISSSNPNRRMPFASHMTDQDRDIIYKWVSDPGGSTR
ncbi:MAG: hypothetical protein K2X47_17620, partial [Bdellovibrionales bacterium]|nr:hypothetical protein [Bdellovibrionales bacterium]